MAGNCPSLKLAENEDEHMSFFWAGETGIQASVFGQWESQSANRDVWQGPFQLDLMAVFFFGVLS